MDDATLKNYYISTMTYGADEQPAATGNLPDKQLAGLFLGIFVAVGVLVLLAATAIPHLGAMTAKGKDAARANEYVTIRIAVMEMLNDSTAGTLLATGPTTDMGEVRTTDANPLVLTDYLNSSNSKTDELGCRYTFDTGGTVIQETR
jgi:hypothetical protein